MNKRRLHHFWRKFRLIKSWYFLALVLVSGVVCILALRSNNEHMVKLRQAVYTADKNNTDVQPPLRALQAYVTSHMNTNLTAGNTSVYPPIQLQYTYQRLVEAQGSQLSQANSELYSQAQAYCEQQNHTDFSGRNRVPCIEQFVQSHNPQQLPTIPDALYKFDFVSPSWSPDLAGWSLLVTVVSGLFFVASLTVKRWFKHHA